MTDSPSTGATPAQPATSHVLGRRSVVRAGAHAAWLVPTIAVVTAAPALAASGPATLTVTASPSATSAALSVHATLTNGATQASTALAVIVRVTPQTGQDFSASTASALPGFTMEKTTTSGPTSATFVYTATSAATQVPGSGSLAFDPVITLAPGAGGLVVPTGTLIIVADPDGDGTTRGSGTYNMTFA